MDPCLTVCVLVCVGEPVQCSAWVGQCALYILIMMFEKVLIMLVLLIPEWKKVRSDISVQSSNLAATSILKRSLFYQLV